MESPYEKWRSQLGVLGGLYWGFLKYPEAYSAVDGSDALFDLWKKRVIRRAQKSGFWRFSQIYGIIGIYAILLFGYIPINPHGHVKNVTGNVEPFILSILMLFFIIYRIQVSIMPAIVGWYEFNKINREILRTTLITPSEIFRAMYRISWTVSVFQFAVIMTLWMILYPMNKSTYLMNPQNLSMLFLAMAFIGFILVAMGYFGYFLLKNMFGIFLGVLAALIPGLYVLADSMFFNKAFTAQSGDAILTRGYLVLIGFPDVFFSEYSKTDVLMRSWVFLVIVALALWILIRVFINKNMERV